MILKKIDTKNVQFEDTINQLLPAYSVNKRKNSCSINLTNGIRVGILNLGYGTTITLSRRTQRSNIKHFQRALVNVENALSNIPYKSKLFREVIKDSGNADDSNTYLTKGKLRGDVYIGETTIT